VKDIILGLISRHRQRGILVDTNLLLLYFIGLFNPSHIQRFKRTNQFTPEDHNTLARVLEPFKGKVMTTPNVLTEVSNLSGQLGEPMRSAYFEMFSRWLCLLDERYTASSLSAQAEHFVSLGLTDAGILGLATSGLLVLTEDFRLAQRLQKIGADVINFNHLRPLAW
jgi:rRNA-processing protein FCF1